MDFGNRSSQGPGHPINIKLADSPKMGETRLAPVSIYCAALMGPLMLSSFIISNGLISLIAKGMRGWRHIGFRFLLVVSQVLISAGIGATQENVFHGTERANFDCAHGSALATRLVCCDEARKLQAEATCQQTVASAAAALAVQIDASLTNGTRPIVRGTTNLPEGMDLIVSIRKAWLRDGQARLAAGIPACGSDCLPLFISNGRQYAHAVVTSGQFTAGPFLESGQSDAAPGKYILEIGSASTGQSAHVRNIIGERGENLQGPLIGGCCFEYNDEAAVRSGKEMNQLLAASGKVQIYFAKYILVGE
jgi:hypothetical protein